MPSRRTARQGMALSLESLLTSRAGFGLTTASTAQRAIARIIDGSGLGALADDPVTHRITGSTQAAEALRAPHTAPPEVYLLAAIRSGKSLLAACAAVRAALTCDLSQLGPGEVPRVSVISVRMDQARPIYDHIRGRVQASPQLRALLVGEPTRDTIVLRHPSGIPVEIMVTAGSRAGSSLVARWSAGVVFDEAPRMVGADEGVVNLDDARRAVLGRLLPGATIFYVGSPWAPFGPVYQATQEHYGSPDPARVVVLRATGPDLHPAYWTPERCERLRRQDPLAHRTDVLGKFLDPEYGLLSSDEVEAATRHEPDILPPDPHYDYVAAIDPATRSNAWTLTVLTCIGRTERGTPRYSVALAKEWLASKAAPLSPEAVLTEIAGILKPYRVTTLLSDQWAADAIRDLALQQGLYISDRSWTTQEKYEAYSALGTAIGMGELELSNEPNLQADLKRIKKRITQTGIAIDLPHTSDGRHCDFASSLALAFSQLPRAPLPRAPRPGTREAIEAEAQALHDRILRQGRQQDSMEYWEHDPY